MHLKALAGALLAASTFALAAAATPAPSPRPSTPAAERLVPADPAVRRGVLPNGLRYAVMHAAQPAGALSIRLGVDVGSYEEAEDERGLAHFLEHMAFRNTKDFPDNSVDGAFAAKGVAFGRDHNAATDLFATRFELDLPTTQASETARGFQWLRDVADGIVFDPAAVDRERGVVLAEKEASDDAAAAVDQAVMRFEAPGLRSTERDPIGLAAVIKTAPPQRLQAFYRRWYRPDNAMVVVVGDQPLDQMEQEVKSAFASWTAAGPKPARAPRTGPPAGRGLDAFTRSEPSLMTEADICRLHEGEARGPETVARLRRAATGEIWRDILNQRLAQARLQPANRLIGAHIAADGDLGDHGQVCLTVEPLEDSWSVALPAAEQELLRFQRSGPTELEVETAIENVRSHLRGAITEAPSRAANDLADTILDHMLRGQTLPDAREQLRAFDYAVEDLSLDDVRAAFARDWSGVGPLISLVSPQAPAPQAIRAAWTAAEAGPGLPAYADRRTEPFAYDFSPAGVVASREVVDLGQFVRIRFKNGVVLNFKQTAFQKNDVAVQLEFGAGRREIAGSDYATAMLGASLFNVGGTGKHSYEELGRMFQDDAPAFQLQVGDDHFYIPGEVTTPNLEDRLKVLAAFMLDPAFRPTLDPLLHEAGSLTYRSYAASPSMTATQALVQAIAPGSPLGLPPQAVLDKIDSAKIAALLKPAVTGAPIDVTLVGDIDERTAVQLVADSLGALPPRTRRASEPSRASYMRFPASAPAPIRALHHGPADKALGQLIWPLWVAVPSRRREEYTVDVLVNIFNNELRRRVRGELGKTYSPTVTSETPDNADQGRMVADIESYPGDLEPLMTEARAVARRLASGAISAEQLEAARAPMLAEDHRQMQTNAHWAEALSGSAEDDQNLKDELDFADMVGSLSLDEVRKVAADWLSQAPVEVLVQPASAQPKLAQAGP